MFCRLGLLLILLSCDCSCAYSTNCSLSELSEWSAWSECSNKCAPGVKTMTRRIVKDISNNLKSLCEKEKNLTHSVPCGIKNNGCEQFCDGDSGECGCRAGLELSSNTKTCMDNNECEFNQGRGPCMQICINTYGSYHCDCFPSYYQAEDKHGCIFNQSYIPAGYPNTSDADKIPKWVIIVAVCFGVLLFIALGVICYLCRDKCKRTSTNRNNNEPLLVNSYKLETFRNNNDAECPDPRYIQLFDSKPSQRGTLQHEKSLEHVYEPIVGHHESVYNKIQNSCEHIYEPIFSDAQKTPTTHLNSDQHVYEPIASNVKENPSTDIKSSLQACDSEYLGTESFQSYNPTKSVTEKSSQVHLPVYEPMNSNTESFQTSNLMSAEKNLEIQSNIPAYEPMGSSIQNNPSTELRFGHQDYEAINSGGENQQNYEQMN